MLELTLPYPPSVNHYKTIGRLVRTAGGKMYQQRRNSKETVGYYYEVYSLWHRKGVSGLGSAIISLQVDVYPPDKRKRDLDGILKVLLDSMQHAKIYDDDCQICRLIVTRKPMIPEGQIVVRIQEYLDAE
jgi:crossover junction endodeoxyribonuclease RusA